MKLEQHLQDLPKHSMEDRLWGNIESQLDATPQLNNKLPLHKANADLWYGIEASLNHTTKRFALQVRHWSVAASIAVIVSVAAVFMMQQEKEYIYYTDEIVVESFPTPELISNEATVLENCTDYPAVCTTPDFTRLKSTLDQLKQEELKLRTLKESTGDPKMELYHSRILKNIQQVEAQMLQMFS